MWASIPARSSHPLPITSVAPAVRSSSSDMWPARHEASSNTDTASVMPRGMRLRLKASYDDSKFTGNAKVISTAMKRYGIIMADNGSNWFVSGENNTKWDDNDVGQL